MVFAALVNQLVAYAADYVAQKYAFLNERTSKLNRYWLPILWYRAAFPEHFASLALLSERALRHALRKRSFFPLERIGLSTQTYRNLFRAFGGAETAGAAAWCRLRVKVTVHACADEAPSCLLVLSRATTCAALLEYVFADFRSRRGCAPVFYTAEGVVRADLSAATTVAVLVQQQVECIVLGVAVVMLDVEATEPCANAQCTDHPDGVVALVERTHWCCDLCKEQLSQYKVTGCLLFPHCVMYVCKVCDANFREHYHDCAVVKLQAPPLA